MVENNILYLNSSGALSNSGSSSAADHNLTADPYFVDASRGDFHVQSASSAINAGITVSMVTADFDGIGRPQGGAYDIGAYEQ